ncbi:MULTISPECIES: diaminopimelate decarboxylase [unclassified Variovorax]|uniref:diaminopimelate decarboxylase n=1 Tax=unclassified Variovorax TaxID=663243 RepID=UPI00257888F0|nr:MULTISPECIES: diaminopimelate decarboxylase [unclassified Variovorax]MDM0088382.1 diaminopimelate decarboxylase [Variovorax sp. J22G40]MDM0146455.1 diaminopimelate decarboxylase [Variovorax sp. J2P1-31]
MSTSSALPGHPHIAQRDGALHVEALPLAALAREHGTPLFVYSKQWMLDALAAYQRGFEGRDALVCYAMKANSSLGVLRVFAEAGCGFDIVSGGELARVLAAGADPAKVIFSGVGKTRAEMRQALAAGIACFNVESEAELEVLNAVALEEAGRRARISIRINPNVDPKTHPYISTGLKGNKFGVAHDRALATYRHAAALPGLEVVGIDCHIGSQITEASPYLDALERVLDLVVLIEEAGIPLHHLDFGGGLGIDYNHDTPPAADALWKQLLARLDARGFGQRKLVVEPGRSLVGNAGVCVTEVLYTKPGEDKNFCIVDAAMNDLPRPAMYQAFHRIVPLAARDAAEATTYDVVGPVCESGDWIGRDRELNVAQGDLLAVLSAGAYCMSMASNYNTRGRAAEVLVAGDLATLIRRRESVEDQLRNELG